MVVEAKIKIQSLTSPFLREMRRWVFVDGVDQFDLKPPELWGSVPHFGLLLIHPPLWFVGSKYTCRREQGGREGCAGCSPEAESRCRPQHLVPHPQDGHPWTGLSGVLSVFPSGRWLRTVQRKQCFACHLHVLALNSRVLLGNNVTRWNLFSSSFLSAVRSKGCLLVDLWQHQN